MCTLVLVIISLIYYIVKWVISNIVVFSIALGTLALLGAISFFSIRKYREKKKVKRIIGLLQLSSGMRISYLAEVMDLDTIKLHELLLKVHAQKPIKIEGNSVKLLENSQGEQNLADITEELDKNFDKWDQSTEKL